MKSYLKRQYSNIADILFKNPYPFSLKFKLWVIVLEKH